MKTMFFLTLITFNTCLSLYSQTNNLSNKPLCFKTDSDGYLIITGGNYVEKSSIILNVIFAKADSGFVSQDRKLIMVYRDSKITITEFNHSKFGYLTFNDDFTGFVYSHNDPFEGPPGSVSNGIWYPAPTGEPQIQAPKSKTNNIVVTTGQNNMLIIITDDGRVMFDPTKVKETLSFVTY